MVFRGEQIPKQQPEQSKEDKMPKQRTISNYQGQHFFVGIDVHLKSWTVTMRSLGMQVDNFTMPPSAEGLCQHLHRKFPGGQFHSVYEAGFSGYAAHRKLISLGINNIVTNPGDVPTRNSERDKKRDRIDSHKLARELEVGSLACIYIPSRPQEDFRTLCRLRQKQTQHGTRLMNRIKQYMHYRGFELPPNEEIRHWSAGFFSWLEAYQREGHNPGADALRITVEELKAQRVRLSETTRLIRKYADNDPIIPLLRTVPGIGFVTAVTLRAELMEMNRFPNVNTLCCYVGLVPASNDSGDKHRGAELSSLGNRHLRYILIEAAWLAVRNDPELFSLFSRDCRRMKKNQAIVKTARRLLSRIRRVWCLREPYSEAVSDKNHAA